MIILIVKNLNQLLFTLKFKLFFPALQNNKLYTKLLFSDFNVSKEHCQMFKMKN